eukprot:CAMPEP_0181299624 /NCGR_PEP_ID=MMETSP1101-20121128/6448_1 /TAXON_ID=46948 /ORGANISM="Rhodomonas abbreviata, Strain Caron Lab Isolate" /LENGTH=500 /DNA_ID=CAMNT_0023404791 /DNA_START=20 /DNA_END=1522 /DNA_ORIENTATION=+
MADIPKMVSDLRRTFDTGVTRPYKWRYNQIKAVSRMVTEHEEEWVAALAVDLQKPACEAIMGEVCNVTAAAGILLKNLKSWMQHEAVSCFGLLVPASCEIRHEPYGVVLVIGPYNYPVQLTLKPLVGALSAGNCVLVKPSEMTPQTSKLLARLIPQYLDKECIKVVEGGVPETQALLAQPFDFFFFTGSHRVGKIVAVAAAEKLKPYVLELGGKNAAIVDESVESLNVVAKRLAWALSYNCGQSCVKPDYVVVLRKNSDKLKQKLVKCFNDFFGDKPIDSPDFARQINKNACLRIQKLLSDNPGEVLCGGEVVPEDRYVAPTILSETPKTSAIMQEEIFGPICSVITVDTIDEAIAYVNEMSDKPLAFYVFSSRSAVIEKCFSKVQSGGAISNDVLMAPVVPNMPFGGLGSSGDGFYQGRYSFETFSHKRSVVRKHMSFDNPACDPVVRYPPFVSSPLKQKVFRFLADNLPLFPPITMSGTLYVLFVIFLIWHLLQVYWK